MSVTGVAVVEGDSGTTQAQVTVSLTAALPTTASVAFTTQPFGAVPHVAEAGSDYQASSGRVTFDPGVTTRTVSITIINDTIAEPTEYFAVALSDPAGTDIAAGLASVTITEDPPETDAFDQAQPVQESSPAGGDDNAAFVSLYGATRDRPIGRGPEVWYSYTPPGDGTATLDVTVDNSGTCTPAATIVVYTGPDLATLTERHVGPCHLVIPVAAGTTYWIAIVPEQQLPTPDLNWLTITRTPGPPPAPEPEGVSVTGVAVVEGDSGTTQAQVTVSLTAALPTTASVAFTTQPFGAVPHVAEAGSDYQASSGRVTSTPSVTTRTVSITIINDTIAEPTEYFAVALSDPAGTDIAAGFASVTITEDPPETDAFDQAQPVQESSPAGGDDNAAFVSLYGATRDRPIGRGPEVWYSYTPPGDGTATLDVTVDNSGTCTPAATIVVYTGPDLATLTEQHVGPCHLVIPVAAGTTYWIAIVPEQQLPTPDLNWLTITRTPSPSLIALTITPAQASVDLPRHSNSPSPGPSATERTSTRATASPGHPPTPQSPASTPAAPPHPSGPGRQPSPPPPPPPRPSRPPPP